jgi:hypothetical protein
MIMTMLVGKQNVGWPLLLLAALGLGGCASVHYARTDQGELRGDLLVKWVEPDLFVFVPVATNPLTFVRADKTAIVPGPMYTDGGSIPRPLWALPAYSPWGYAPAFVVHDWLFDRKHCDDPTYASYTVTDAAWVMSEVMKTMIEGRGAQPGDKTAVYSCSRRFARRLLSNSGSMVHASPRLPSHPPRKPGRHP